MCLSGEVGDNWTPFIELIIFIVFQGYNVAAHVGVWIVAKTKIIDITSHAIHNVSISGTRIFNSTLNNSTLNNSMLNNSTLNNSTTGSRFVNKLVSPEEIWNDLIEFRQIYFYACCVGIALFVIHLMILLPNVVKHFLEADPAILKDDSAHWYFRHVFLMNIFMLIISSIAFDIPVAVLTIRLLEDIWRGDALTIDDKLSVSKTMITLSLSGLAFIALYKGMMPLFLWIGNPFCFPCVPLRMLITFPGGLVTLVMTFAPPMGYAKNSLLTFTPPEMQAQLGDLANTFFSIGMIFWGVFFVVIIIVTICYFKFCRDDSKGGCLCC